MKAGRNDPCPCGSGKKFKRCCIDAGWFESRGTRSVKPRIIVLAGEIGDYGAPAVNDDFFQHNPFAELSAARLLYSNMVQPQIEPAVSRLMNRLISRGQEEEEKIRNTDDPAELVAILKHEPDPLNQQLLLGKILQRREVTVPLLIEELYHEQNDCFVELAVRILYESKMECVSSLLRLIESTPLDAYALGLICLLLRMTGGPETLKPLWDRFHFFKEKYTRENFSQGPLLGLWELREKIPLLCGGTV